MTKAQQTRFYFPLWRDVCVALDWHMVKGRLMAARDPNFGSKESRVLYNAVWDAAEKLAAQDSRAVTVDDLRHACHYVANSPRAVAASGPIPRISSATLTNAQVNRVAALFNVLKDQDSVKAMVRWSDPSIAQREQIVRTINKIAPEAYICEVAKMFPGFTYPFWEDLELRHLINLQRILRTRAEQHGGRISEKVGTAVPSGPSEPATDDTVPEPKMIDISKLREVHD